MTDQDEELYQKQKLLIADADDGTVAAMLGFGGMIFSEVLQRSAQIDSKLVGYIAYATGIIALLSINSTGHDPSKHPWSFIGLVAAVVPAVLAVGIAAYGVRARVHDVPGDEVWISEFKTGDLPLRKSYVVALLRSRKLQREINVQKAAAMRDAEIALAFAGIATVIVLIYRVFF